jgi:hypothetical protein
MDTKKAFQELIERAKKDPKFFHALVFNPKEVLSSLSDLNKQSREAIIGANPEELFAHLLGVQGGGNDSSIRKGCGHTCSSSCGYTCGAGSCAHTTSIQGGDPSSEVAK